MWIAYTHSIRLAWIHPESGFAWIYFKWIGWCGRHSSNYENCQKFDQKIVVHSYTNVVEYVKFLNFNCAMCMFSSWKKSDVLHFRFLQLHRSVEILYFWCLQPKLARIHSVGIQCTQLSCFVWTEKNGKDFAHKRTEHFPFERRIHAMTPHWKLFCEWKAGYRFHVPELESESDCMLSLCKHQCNWMSWSDSIVGVQHQ